MLQAPILDGNYQVDQLTYFQSSTVTLRLCSAQQYSSSMANAGDILELCGSLLDAEGGERATYSLNFFSTPLSVNQLSFTLTATRTPTDILISGPNNRLFFSYSCTPDESFHGFGESFTSFNLRHRVVPVLVSEQGVGRGLQPITDYLNTNVAQGAGGDWYTTYAPKPLYLTNLNHSLVFHNSEVMFFNLTAPDWVAVELWGLEMAGNILSGASMEALVGEVTLVTGRMRTPPEWTQRGAVVSAFAFQ